MPSRRHCLPRVASCHDLSIQVKSLEGPDARFQDMAGDDLSRTHVSAQPIHLTSVQPSRRQSKSCDTKLPEDCLFAGHLDYLPLFDPTSIVEFPLDYNGHEVFAMLQPLNHQLPKKRTVDYVFGGSKLFVHPLHHHTTSLSWAGPIAPDSGTTSTRWNENTATEEWLPDGQSKIQ